MSTVEPRNSPSRPPTTPRRPKTAGEGRSPFFKNKTHLDNAAKRDSGLAPSVSTMGHDSFLEGTASLTSSRSKADVPSIVVNDDYKFLAPADQQGDVARPQTAPSRGSASPVQTPAPENDPAANRQGQFKGITTDIPTGDFDDPFTSHLSFSNRGSVLLDGKKANALFGAASPGGPARSITQSSIPQRTMSSTERRLSQKVRMLYERGDENAVIQSERSLSGVSEEPAEHDSGSTGGLSSSPVRAADAPVVQTTGLLDPASAKDADRLSVHKKEPWEAAGGIEDLRDVSSGDIDRYGFIKPRAITTRTSSNVSKSQLPTVDEAAGGGKRSRKPPPDASKSRRLSVLSKKPESTKSSRPPSRATSRAESHAPSVSSARSQRSTRSSIFSSHSSINKGRRWADAAPGMLTSQPGLPGSPPPREPSPATDALERRREEKWARMAQRVPSSSVRNSRTTPALGAGSMYTFDIADAKLISRTWKGIPDRWRATAWYSSLTLSARRRASKEHPFIPDDELVDRYKKHQEDDCADDMQIDMDVPRTISGHVMFRTRYRGGQRLLFRVLRALSLEYPETGYVQGMAPLIATLLCYYEEERAFVLGCRLWEYRGLAELFKPGFVGLMGALEVFEADWLGRLPIKKTLDDVGVTPMSYGTKWYLTLFCYSLPFPAQLRVWDVFFLLGGGEGGIDGMGTLRHETTRDFMQLLRANGTDGAAAPTEKGNAAGKGRAASKSKHGFDVLHAVAAALVDALQEGLVDSDFENAMKLMTSNVPVGQEDVLMRVAQREWKEQKKAKR